MVRVTGHGGVQALAAARRLSPLDRVVLHAPSAAVLPGTHPAREKIAAASQPQAFVCVGQACSLPITDPGALTAAIDAVRHS